MVAKQLSGNSLTDSDLAGRSDAVLSLAGSPRSQSIDGPRALPEAQVASMSPFRDNC
ncbi:protein of unknown function [Cupriavidus taiwanensis]|nr:protein of unknown function [Cupriavidus taiwanensis]